MGFAQGTNSILEDRFTIQLDRLKKDFGYQPQKPVVFVSVKDQTLYLIKNDSLINSYKISTSKYGIGAQKGSNQTPLGVHSISRKFGRGAAKGAIFKARQNTGKIANIITEAKDDKEDYVTSRVMWLEGLEPGINKGGNVDSYQRYIYIHGTHEEGLIGGPASHGCIRMLNDDVIELFDLVEEGTFVVIIAN